MTTTKPVNISRRSILQLGMAAVATGLSGHAASQQKIAKNLVQYQDAPKNGQECDQCLQFEAPEGCKVVEGKISPKGWCAAFAPKPKT